MFVIFAWLFMLTVLTVLIIKDIDTLFVRTAETAHLLLAWLGVKP